MSVAGLVAAVLAGLVLLESGLRLYTWRHAPARLRWLYAAFLLNDEAIQAVSEVRQRAERAAVRSFEELFALYATAAGMPKERIEALFGFPMGWRDLLESALVLRNHLRWHVGLVPIPNQRLRTVTIADDGRRSTGATHTVPERGASAVVKRVLITGGSVAYGYGATSDGTTIAGRLQEHLNRRDSRPAHRWEVVNGAFPAATSFQELLVVLQGTDPVAPPDYFVSISGCNDVDQQFCQAEGNVSALAQAYTNSLERRWLGPRALRGMRRCVLIAALRRWAAGYQCWPGPHAPRGGRDSRRVGRVPNEIDQPDIYPLW